MFHHHTRRFLVRSVDSLQAVSAIRISSGSVSGLMRPGTVDVDGNPKRFSALREHKHDLYCYTPVMEGQLQQAEHLLAAHRRLHEHSKITRGCPTCEALRQFVRRERAAKGELPLTEGSETPTTARTRSIAA